MQNSNRYSMLVGEQTPIDYPNLHDDIQLAKQQAIQYSENPYIYTKNPYLDQKNVQQIIHQIQPHDTLQGVSLQYGVSILKLRQRNKLQSNDIYYLKKIIIPDPKFNIESDTYQSFEDKLIRDFLGHMDFKQRSDKTARYYLSIHDWAIDAALKQYQDDLQWEKNNKMLSIPIQKKKKMNQQTLPNENQSKKPVWIQLQEK